MTTIAAPVTGHAIHPVHIHVEPAYAERNRLTVAFRIILAIPHLLLVGGPVAAVWAWTQSTDGGVTKHDWSAGAGALGAVAAVCALIAWFAILFTGRYPEGLRSLVTFYLRWRVRATAYVAMLRDEYPPFGEGDYPASFEFVPLNGERNRVSVAFRPILIIPHLIVIWVLGIAWGLTSIIAWFAVLFTGEYPRALYHFALNVFQWNTRVEAYGLLLHDEYPPFSFD
jgi:uncharacterized protein DUF4389